MTLALGLSEAEALKWHELVDYSTLNRTLHNLWEEDTPDLYGCGVEPKCSISVGNFAPMATIFFPDEWV